MMQFLLDMYSASFWWHWHSADSPSSGAFLNSSSLSLSCWPGVITIPLSLLSTSCQRKISLFTKHFLSKLNSLPQLLQISQNFLVLSQNTCTWYTNTPQVLIPIFIKLFIVYNLPKPILLSVPSMSPWPPEFISFCNLDIWSFCLVLSFLSFSAFNFSYSAR